MSQVSIDMEYFDMFLAFWETAQCACPSLLFDILVMRAVPPPTGPSCMLFVAYKKHVSVDRAYIYFRISCEKSFVRIDLKKYSDF